MEVRFEPVLKRKCGACTLCCTLVPVGELKKAANTKCTHQFSGGCRIYAHRPMSCSVWNCRWLVDETTRDLRRPDHMHYVIDAVPDQVVATDNETGEKSIVEVTVIWADPKHPLAHRDPALRQWIEEQNHPVLVRHGNTGATALIPPGRTQNQQWIEMPAQLTQKKGMDWAIEETENQPQRG